MKHALLRETAALSMIRGSTYESGLDCRQFAPPGFEFNDAGLVVPAGFATGRDLHVDQHLTNIAINYRPQAFIADQIAPIVPVDKETNTYPVYSRFEKFAVEDTTRVRGREANKITRSVGSQNYQARNYALGFDVAIEDRANMDAAYRAELDAGAATYLIEKLGIDYERRVVNLADTAGSVTSVFLTGSSWVGAGDPISQVFQMIEYVQGFTGQRPNSVLFGWKAWNYFRRNVNVRNFIRGTNNGGGIVTREQVTNLFEFERFLVSEALWHTANEAQSAASPTLVNPIAEDVFVYYAPLAPSLNAPSWMYTFRWNNPLLPTPLVVERHPYDSKKKVETIEAGYYQDERITGVDYGVKLTNVNSAQANGLV